MRIPLSDIAATTLGNFGMLAETMVAEADRPRQGNDVFAAFGRDFAIQGGRRLMVVAITPRQWRAVVKTLELEASVAALETELGVSFAGHEAVRYEHRDRLYPMFEAAFATRTPRAGTGEPAFEAEGVCWSARPIGRSRRRPRTTACSPAIRCSAARASPAAATIRGLAPPRP